MHEIEERVSNSYGFLPDLSLSAHRNAQNVLGNMTQECYFTTVANKAFHDLTNGKSLPVAAAQLLGMGLNFIPRPERTSNDKEISQAFDRLERNIGCKSFFAGAQDDEDFKSTKLRVPSLWQPPLLRAEVDSRLQAFDKGLKQLFTPRNVKDNLSPFQRGLLSTIAENDNIIIASADKGLGPVAVEMPWYVKRGLKFLANPKAYCLLTEEQALLDATKLKREILDWISRYRDALTDDEAKFLKQKLAETIKDPFGYFYLLVKLHKTPVSARPVCSDVASLPHALGQWVDQQLQPIVTTQHTYFKNSIELKLELDEMTLAPNESLFTMDAVSMYDNIPLDECIERLAAFLSKPETMRRFPHYSPKALIAAIRIVMKNNRMRFGDIIAKQILGIAMGMSPAPTIANLFVALHEIKHLLKFLRRFLRYLKRFIDDGFGIWIHDSDPLIDANNWKLFQDAVNCGSLDWTFSHRGKKVVFMDMTLEIVAGNIVTSLYAKPNALHLYIPPHSCHAPGVITGHIFGQVLRIYQLCTLELVQEAELYLFFGRLLDRGYQSDDITPIFANAIDNATRYLARSNSYRRQLKAKEQDASRRCVFYHMLYHPGHPTSSQVQQLWREKVFCPSGKRQLNNIPNGTGH